MTSYWHPFANMATVKGNEFVVTRGEGVYVFDAAGNRYLDATASLWYANIGHGRAEIVEAVKRQMESLAAFHTFGDYANPTTLALADRLASIAPVPGSKVFLTSGGSDSVDTAAKLARRYFAETGEPERVVFVIRDWAYHGMHGFGTSFAGIDPNRAGTGPLVQDVVRVPHDSVEDLERAIDEVGPDRLAGFFCEPVLGAGGVRPVTDTYLKDSRRLVDEAGALFIADEVITGFGRVGAWFASERFSLEPDIVTFAKGVTSGYLPLGGVLASPKVAEPFWADGTDAVWRHGYTYSGHPTVCAAALANLDIIEREGLIPRVLELEIEIMEALESLLDHPNVAGLRGGVGALAAVQLDPDLVAEDPSAAARGADAARSAGVITRAIAGGGFQVSPPFTITSDQLDELAAGLRAGLDAI
ncbi:MAG TPA: aminotransferase class III-fold pyridoxal phosphate-dependent enzyme [Acidimicrobiia bacterium]|jgi:adenosylmethionine-8-amino-7-oxononanoate aminotransferase